MIKKEEIDEKLELKNISVIKNMGVGYDEDSFVIAFNKEGNAYENAYIIQADRLKEIIGMLFEAGVNYQQKMKVDIGFGIGDDTDAREE